ncbi:hydroxymethylglutaryl-CoA lyase [Burkholderia sp. CF099]|nr:hydroxymethylglutaryl-CoA lyase [Burkholderia sp. CF099]
MNAKQDPVIVHEVGLRAGIQELATILPTEDKKRWIDSAYAAGIRHMELASFGLPGFHPQLSDGPQVVEYARGHSGLTITGLVSSVAGAYEAFSTGVKRIVVPLPISTLHSLSTLRKTPRDMAGILRTICDLRDRASFPSGIEVVATLATAFGCNYQGRVKHVDVCDMALHAVDAGCDTLALADTTGHATPSMVGDLIEDLLPFSAGRLSLAHFNNSCGLALANIVMALRYGIREFDSALAGLSGNHTATGSASHVVTEDLVFMLEGMGFQTHIEMRKLLACREILDRTFGTESLEGFVARRALTHGWRH